MVFNSPHSTELSLEQEGLRSEYLRSGLLIVLFAFGILVAIINYFFVDETMMSVYGGTKMYATTLFWLSAFVSYQVGVFVYLKRRLNKARPISRTFKFLHALIEVSYPSMYMFYVLYHHGILVVIDSPLSHLYFVFIILSILHLDFKINILMGVMCAIQYVAIIYFAFHVVGSQAELQVPENSYYLRAVLFILSAGAAAFVSADLLSRIQLSHKHKKAKTEIELLFGQQVSREVSQALIEGGGKSRRQEATVMFLDIRNFTSYADSHTAEEVIEYQNHFLAPVIDIINQHQGVVFQILGDGIMACFGSPVENVLHADMAFQAGVEILKRTADASRNGIIPDTQIGIGLHSGTLVTGNIGNEQRKQFSISGTPVIVASRIEQLNKKYDTEFLISDEVYSRITPGRHHVEFLGTEPLRGLGKPIAVYTVRLLS